MQLIAYKNKLVNYINFLTNVVENDDIDGFTVPIVKTKDNTIILFDDNMGEGINTEVLQSSTIEDLKQTSVIELNQLLTELSKLPNTFKKRIILNIYPLITPILSNETIFYVNQLNKEYVILIKEEIDKFPNLDISLCTINTNLLQEIKRNINNHPLGLIIDESNPTYVEADFYVLKPIMLDATIIKQELDIGKEIMIAITSNDDLSLTYTFFRQETTALKNELFLKLTFMTGYPDIFNNLFK